MAAIDGHVDRDAEAKALAKALRLGHLRVEDLDLAAFAGHAAARLVVGDPAQRHPALGDLTFEASVVTPLEDDQWGTEIHWDKIREWMRAAFETFGRRKLNPGVIAVGGLNLVFLDQLGCVLPSGDRVVRELEQWELTDAADELWDAVTAESDRIYGRTRTDSESSWSLKASPGLSLTGTSILWTFNDAVTALRSICEYGMEDGDVDFPLRQILTVTRCALITERELGHRRARLGTAEARKASRFVAAVFQRALWNEVLNGGPALRKNEQSEPD